MIPQGRPTFLYRFHSKGNKVGKYLTDFFFFFLQMADKFSAVSELAEVAVLERAMLNECRELLSSVAAMQVII